MYNVYTIYIRLYKFEILSFLLHFMSDCYLSYIMYVYCVYCIVYTMQCIRIVYSVYV